MTVGLGVSIGTVNTVCATTGEGGARAQRGTGPDRPLGRGGAGAGPSTWRTTLTFDSAGTARVGRIPEHGRALAEFADLTQRGAPATRVGHRVLSPADLVATVAHSVLTDTFGAALAPDAGVAVSHPIGYPAECLAELREALDTVGLPQAVLVAEPIAALAWLDAAHGPLAPGLTLVYDLGASNLGVTLVRVGADAPADPVVGVPLRSPDYGGRAFGALMASQAARSTIRGSEGGGRELTTTARSGGIGGRADTPARSLADSDAAISDLRATHVRRSLEVVYRCLRTADVTMADVDRVLVVGGAARPREVAETLAEALARPVIVAPDPERTIAEGAAIMARRSAAAQAAAQRRPGVARLPRRLVRAAAAVAIVGAAVLVGLVGPAAAVSAGNVVVNGVHLAG
ncbi:Hsp70 family protein [Nocardia sp. NEAU-G5]|uniref:Hsp70 family protein n=1 Tax=Nocardia albiluteola TaxID=2842303 RepID=A0ABS6B0V9_9NOCA|nr:Hsp70 family protein [Nocardia albiluteola]MBU3062920.1 Hsp70 family protein [Nocardia albiluteola]